MKEINQTSMFEENPPVLSLRERRFLLRDLPADLKRSSPHWQYTDNYLTGTGLNLRFVRVPETNERSYLLRREWIPDPANLSHSLLSEMPLTFEEYQKLLTLENREVRFNRYFRSLDGNEIAIDMYLGPLLNLFIARSSSTANMIPDSSEITDEEMFTGSRLSLLTATDIRAELARRQMTKTSNGEN